MGGKALSGQEWQEVPYSITPNTKVLTDADVYTKVKELVGSPVERVWGFEDCECKMPLGLDEDGAAVPLYWIPEQTDGRAVCGVLLSIPNVKAIFRMGVDRVDDVTQLTPIGVAFRTMSPTAIPADSKLARLTGSAA